MNYTITINASTPEELSAILAKLQTSEPVTAVHPPIQDQPTYQQYQALTQPAATQQPIYTPATPVSSAAAAAVAYQYPPVIHPVIHPEQQGYGQQQLPASVPTAPATYTMDQLAQAGTQLMDAGRQTDLINLLGSFGVQALTALPKERYGEFATALRQLGAKI